MGHRARAMWSCAHPEAVSPGSHEVVVLDRADAPARIVTCG